MLGAVGTANVPVSKFLSRARSRNHVQGAPNGDIPKLEVPFWGSQILGNPPFQILGLGKVLPIAR